MKSVIRSMMLEDILNQGERVAEQMPQIEAQLTGGLERFDPGRLGALYLVGCGDSYYAGQAVRHICEEWTGLRVEPAESLEFSRYMVPRLQAPGLVVAVSVSGQVGRTLECLELAGARGLGTAGITGTPGSRIFSVGDLAVDMGIRVREPGPVPQTVYYLANQVSLLLLALHLGRARGVLTDAEVRAHRNDILQVLAQVRATAESNRERVMDWVVRRNAPRPLVIVGGGPNWATALFATAKLIEAALTVSVPQELEEWAHEQYFVTGPDLPTVLIGARGAAEDRVAATARAIRSIDGECLAVAPATLPGLAELANAIWEVPECPEHLSPLLYKVPTELLGWAYAEHLDVRPFNYDSELRKRTVETTIYAGGQSAEAVNRRRESGR